MFVLFIVASTAIGFLGGVICVGILDEIEGR